VCQRAGRDHNHDDDSPNDDNGTDSDAADDYDALLVQPSASGGAREQRAAFRLRFFLRRRRRLRALGALRFFFCRLAHNRRDGLKFFAAAQVH
jgi:hypothetical protein